MSEDLFAARVASSDFAERAISPKRELGAYEALWAREGAWFKSMADSFRERAGAIPSDFVSKADIEKYARLALGAIRDAGIKQFGIRIHGAGEYPQKLRDADHPVELLYFQGLWDLVNTRCVAIVGTREPSEDGKLRAAKLARLLVGDGFTVVSGLARGIDTVAHTTAHRRWWIYDCGTGDAHHGVLSARESWTAGADRRQAFGDQPRCPSSAMRSSTFVGRSISSRSATLRCRR